MHLECTLCPGLRGLEKLRFMGVIELVHRSSRHKKATLLDKKGSVL